VTAVEAYDSEPVYTLDADIVVVAAHLPKLSARRSPAWTTSLKASSGPTAIRAGV
jgi:hypothetical protein